MTCQTLPTYKKSHTIPHVIPFQLVDGDRNSRLNGSHMGSCRLKFPVASRSLLVSSETSCKAEIFCYFFNSDSNLGTKGSSGPQVRRGVYFACSFTENFALSANHLGLEWMSFDDYIVELKMHEVDFEVKLTEEFYF